MLLKAILSNIQLLLLIIIGTPFTFNSASGSLIFTPSNREALVGERVQFYCKTSESLPVDWQQILWPSQKRNYVFLNNEILSPYIERFSIDLDSESGRYNLIIKSVQKEDVGVYRCMDKAGAGEQREGGLILLESPPKCKVQVDSTNNDLQNISLSCDISYAGPIEPTLDCKNLTQSGMTSSYREKQWITKHQQLQLYMPLDQDLSSCCWTSMSKIKAEVRYSAPTSSTITKGILNVLLLCGCSFMATAFFF